MMMIIGSEIVLKDAPKELIESMKKALSLRNEGYYQALKRNPNARNFLSPVIKYYKEKDGMFWCGRGLEERIIAWCEKHGEELELIERTSKPPLNVVSTIKLRDYQEGVPEAVIQHAHGIMKLHTGFGKTIVAIRVAELLQTTALFIVPKTSILHQFVTEIEQYMGKKPGILGDGERTIEPFTVATVQTLQRLLKTLPPEQKNDFAKYYGAVFVDECDRFVPDKSRKVVEFFAPRYLYGMSATPKRTDKQTEALNFMFGPIIVEREDKKRPPQVKVIVYAGKILMGEYHDIIKEHVNDYDRNQLIAAVVQAEIRKGRKVLVLTKRVEHFEILEESIRGSGPVTGVDDGDGSGMVHTDRIIALRSSGSQKDRARLLSDLRSRKREFDCLLGTYSLLATGVDIPALDTLIVAGDLKSEVLAEQAAGRILRLFEGKPEPVVIDICDIGNFILKRQGKERQNFYVLQSWPIADYDLEKEGVVVPPKSTEAK